MTDVTVSGHPKSMPLFANEEDSDNRSLIIPVLRKISDVVDQDLSVT